MSQDKRSFGTVSRLPSGRYRARYTGPDGAKHSSPTTYDDRDTAVTWLRNERQKVEDPLTVWTPPRERATAAKSATQRRGVTLGVFAESWLAGRRVKGQPLAARTRVHYRTILDEHILPTFGHVALTAIEPEDVDAWYAVTLPTAPTMRAHSYGLLKAILATAVDRRVIGSNPARITGGGQADTEHESRPATLAELEIIAANMPDRLRLMVLLAAWCAMRQGELFELRRSDVLTGQGIIRIRRGVVRAAGETIVKKPKTSASSRDVAIPPHLLPLVREHLLQHTQPGAQGLLFPARDGAQLAPSTLYGRESTGTRKGYGFYAARQAAGRPDLRFHDLRHTGATMAAQTGATLAELMSRLGHADHKAALRYQHAASERDQEIARRLSAMVTGDG